MSEDPRRNQIPPLSLGALLKMENILQAHPPASGKEGNYSGISCRRQLRITEAWDEDAATPPSIVAEQEVSAVSSWDEQTPELGGKFNF